MPFLLPNQGLKKLHGTESTDANRGKSVARHVLSWSFGWLLIVRLCETKAFVEMLVFDFCIMPFFFYLPRNCLMTTSICYLSCCSENLLRQVSDTAVIRHDVLYHTCWVVHKGGRHSVWQNYDSRWLNSVGNGWWFIAKVRVCTSFSSEVPLWMELSEFSSNNV